MMGKSTVILFILNVVYCLADIQFNYTTVGTAENIIKVKHLNFIQWLDHTNLEDKRQFIQRYAVTATFYKKNGPAFLLVNGEHTLDRHDAFSNSMLVYAQYLNAICFSLEHRFYGGSWPVNGSMENHLSTAQALSDVAYFITRMTNEFHLPKDTKWIVFGISYGGTLAAWSRLKFPDLIFGAVASSAPVLAKIDYFEYDQIAEKILKSYDSKCVESIQLAFEDVALLVDKPEIRKNISEMFHLENNASETIDSMKSLIIHIMLIIIEEVVQYDDVCPISIPLFCRIITSYNGTKVEALAEIETMFFELRYGLISSKRTPQNQNSVKDIGTDNDATWKYQRCSELGYFSSYANVTFLSGVKHLLLSIEKGIEIECRWLLGPNFSVENVTDKISRTNSQYGGLNFNGSNTIFINGSLDPWYKTSLYKKSNSSLYDTIFIEGTSHGADTHRPKKTDIPELKNARLRVFKILNSWLNEISTSNNSRN